MTLPQLSTSVPLPTTVGGRRSVTLLSGFLGSGKTTLLRAELRRAGERAPAVVLNDFAQTPVDDAVLSGGNGPVMITGGCVCCTRREDLSVALSELLDAEQRGMVPRRQDVVIETSGLSDPGPIAFTLANDPVLQHHYALARVSVTVDALTGLETIEHHDIALRQVLAADQVVITKTDLVDSHDVDRLLSQIRDMNPSATILVTALGQIIRELAPVTWNTDRADSRFPHDRTHLADISTLEVSTDEPVDWQAFSVWLSLLLHSHGPDVLRIKGVLDVRNAGRVAINGVQHIMHRPEHLGPDVPSGTRLVIIFRGIDPELLEASFRAFVGID
jgi:G3E family GTPase